MTVIMDRPMAKRNDGVAKIDEAVLDDARIVAAYRKKTLAEYLSEVLRPIVASHKAEHARATVSAVPIKSTKGKADKPEAK